MKTRLIAVLLPALAILAVASPAGAATSGTSSEAVSENWAGYEATTTNSDGFKAVSGSWTQPTVSASASDGASYSAYWVGLGGGDEDSDALEQDGTQADVSASGKVTYYAWYELVPSAPVKVPVTVKPGDKVYARTVVNGDEVTFTIDNKTTGQDWTKTVAMTDATPDTSTAEWVVEAPSACQGSSTSDCQVLQLADFGKATITDAHAKSDGTVKPISGYSNEAIELSPSAGSSYGGGGGYGGGGFGGGFGPESATTSAGNSEGAAPGDLSSDGTSFTVTYGSDSAVSGASAAGSSSSAYGDSGYGDTSGYGETGGYGDSGYGETGYGYGDSGYGETGGYGDSGYGETGGYGDSGYGETGGYGYGDSEYGDSGYGDSGASGYLSSNETGLLGALAAYSEAYYNASASTGATYY